MILGQLPSFPKLSLSKECINQNCVFVATSVFVTLTVLVVIHSLLDLFHYLVHPPEFRIFSVVLCYVRLVQLNGDVILFSLVLCYVCWTYCLTTFE